MKLLSKFLLLLTMAFGFAACNKLEEDLPLYESGKAVTLTASSPSIIATVADSSKNVISLTWTDPQYAADSATFKYIIQIDSAGRNFSNPYNKEVIGTRSASLTGREINTIVLNYGFALGVAHSLDVRVISSYSNNNERYMSNTVKVAVTPFTDPSVLTTQKTSVTGTAPTATDPSNTFSWTTAFTGYTGVINYTLQYDSAGKNFATIREMSIGTARSKTLTQEEMNNAAMASGIAIGNTGKVDFRIKAVTAGGAIAYSNAVSVTIATFSPVPANLYIVGGATPGGWNNPVSTPAQQFTKVDANTFRITIALTAGESYLFLPVNGSWDSKYGGATNGTAAGGGVLLKDGAVPGSNTPAPATSGFYTITVNFQTNRYTVTPVVVPANLYIVGGATPGGWTNPVSTPAQEFTRIDNVSYGIVVNLTAGESYLFLPVNGSWDNKFGGATDGTATAGGTLLANNAVPGSNTPAPATSGLYKIVVNFGTNTYTVTPYTGPSNLFIVGSATLGGWSNPVPTPSQQFIKVKEGVFQLAVPLTAGESYLFLPVNGSWDNKFGGATDGTAVSGGVLLANNAVPGSNTPSPATSGMYNVTVNFITNTYKVSL